MGLASRAPVGGGEPAADEAAPSRVGEPVAARLAPSLALLVVAVGAATLIAEIAAARLLAPFFGASTFIWANTIAVVLLALSAGYALGGRLADRRPRERDLRAAVLVAAVLLAAVPFAGQPFLRAAATAFDEIQAGAFIASLVAVLVLAAVPLALLGTVGPWAVRLATPSVAASGRAAGRLYALSTLGSLAGTFLAALVLVPELGTQRTFVLAAAGLALAAAAAGGLPRAALLVPAALAGLLAVPVGVTRTPPDGARVLLERETPYQYVRVEQAGDERRLILNEGRAVHSVWRPGTVLTGDYWDGYLVIPLASQAAPPRTMAMLGNAGGTVARAYGRYFPATRFDAVEIDPQLTRIGRRWFGMAGPNLHTFAQDARPFLEATRRRYDVIGVDAYRQPYIPFYLATREFFALAREHLTAAGMVVVNVGHPAGDDGLEKALTATARAAGLAVTRFPLEDTNTLLVASRRPLDPRAIARRAELLPPALRPLARQTAATGRPALRGGAVWTDDRAPVEWLVDTSIVKYAAKDGAR
jgi:spermidine synthase